MASDPIKRGDKMILSKIKLLSAAVGGVALIASLALAGTFHKAVAAAAQAYDAKAVVGPNGEHIGVPADPRVGAELERDGLPN